jgi:hypothetical protein
MVIACLALFPLTIVAIYFSRSISKLDQQKSNLMRLTLVLSGIMVLLVMFAYPMYDAYQSHENPLMAFQFVGVFIYYIFILYLSHWWSIAELIFIPLVDRLLLGGFRIWYRPFWAIDEEQRFVLRDDPEQGFYHGRILKSAFSIPRIVDFVPRRGVAIAFIFVLAYFSHSLQYISEYLYLGAYVYPMLHVIDRCYVAAGLEMHCAHSVMSSYALTSAVFMAFVPIPLFILSPYLGSFFARVAGKGIKFSIDELTKYDPRPPILFLRAFKDDQVQLGNAKMIWAARVGGWLHHIGDLDRLLLEEGTPYGPVIAIGNPGDEWPPYGAARAYFDDKTCFDDKAWQQAVMELAKSSLAIVLCVDDTEGMWWEVEHVAGSFTEKTLLLVHPKFGRIDNNTEILRKVASVLGRSNPAVSTLMRRSALEQISSKQAPILGLFVDRKRGISIASSSTFSRVAFLLVVRSFLRTKWRLAK